MLTMKKRIIVGITGASGIIYGISLLNILKEVSDIETHLIISNAAKLTMQYETDLNLNEIKDLADKCYNYNDIAAPIASGSYKTLGMIIVPCSVKTFSEIATGVTNSLLTRAADVILKERRKLILMVRETPLHSGHLETLLKLSQLGAIIVPPVPAFYNNPKTLEELVDYSIIRALDLFDLNIPSPRRWKSEE
ncbi:Phenolic acid decarboxylase subunit B [Rickettsiales bacterium Ac37b]|nr:Phenolic acid decarboxylase subunit B [Rickettsiales bacterium Ac37b]